MNSFLEQYLPEEYLRATYRGVPFNKGPFSQDEGEIISAYKRAEADPASTREGRAPPRNMSTEAMKPVKMTGGYGPAEPNFPGLLAAGMRGVGNYVDRIPSAVADVAGDVTGLNDYQDYLQNDAVPEDFPDFENMPTAEAPTNLLNLETPPELPQKEITPSTTLADLKEIQVTAQKRQKVQTQNALVAEGAKGILKAGGSKEELKGWGKFSKEFDLQALGMALLATSGNGEGLLPNLGQALMFAKATRKEEEAEKAASAAAYRKEKRAYSKLEIEQLKALIEKQKAESKEKTDAAGAYSDRMKAEAAGQTADAASLRAQASMVSAQNGGSSSIPTNIKAYAKIGAAQAYPGMPENSVKALGEAISGTLAEEARLAKAAGIPFDIPARAKELAAQHSSTVDDSGWFPWSHDYSIPGID